MLAKKDGLRAERHHSSVGCGIAWHQITQSHDQALDAFEGVGQLGTSAESQAFGSIANS